MEIMPDTAYSTVYRYDTVCLNTVYYTILYCAVTGSRSRGSTGSALEQIHCHPLLQQLRDDGIQTGLSQRAMGLTILVHELRKLEASPQTVGLHQMPVLAKAAPAGGQRHLTQVLGHRIPQCVDGVIAINTAVPLRVAPEALHWRQLAVELGQEVVEVVC